MKDEIKEILDKLKDKNNYISHSMILLSIKETTTLYDYITNLQKKVEQYENPDDLTLITMYCDLKAKDKIKQLQEENDYLKDIVSNTELSDEIKKADKWSKRELYKINYQRLQVNGRLREENERLNDIINELEKELKEGSFDVYFCSTSSQKTFKSNEIIIKAMILDKLKELKGSERNFTKEELEAEENYYKRHQVPFKENYEDYYKGSDK